MMSTFDIPPPRPKIIIRQLGGSAAAAPGYEYPAPPTHLLFNLRLTFISVSSSLCLLCHSSTHLFLIFFFIPSISLCPILAGHPRRLFAAPGEFSFECNQPLLCSFPAESGLFSRSHNPVVIYLLSAHSLFPFTSSAANLSVCMSALSPLCQLIPAIHSIKCFCMRSLAAFLSRPPPSSFRFSTPAPAPSLPAFSLRC